MLFIQTILTKVGDAIFIFLVFFCLNLSYDEGGHIVPPQSVFIFLPKISPPDQTLRLTCKFLILGLLYHDFFSFVNLLYKKFPTFPFFNLINCLPAAKIELKKLKEEIWQVPFRWMAFSFGSNCFSLTSWHTSNLIKWTKKARF